MIDIRPPKNEFSSTIMSRSENESAVLWLCRQPPVDASGGKRMPGALGDVRNHAPKRYLFSSGYNFEAHKNVAGKI